MKKLFIVANWKSNKTTAEAKEWVEGFKIYDLGFKNENKEIIICPSFIHLPLLNSYLLNHKSNIKLGAQDISAFGPGAYTGEVNASQIKEFATYTIIGHSERRNYFKEDDEMLAKKVQAALAVNITPIFCIQGKETPIPDGVTIVAFEPISAIGTGQPDTPEDAEEVAKTVKAAHPNVSVLYGGSVTPDQVHIFTQLPSVDGVLVGGASLDIEKFTQLTNNA